MNIKAQNFVGFVQFRVDCTSRGAIWTILGR